MMPRAVSDSCTLFQSNRFSESMARHIWLCKGTSKTDHKVDAQSSVASALAAIPPPPPPPHHHHHSPKQKPSPSLPRIFLEILHLADVLLFEKYYDNGKWSLSPPTRLTRQPLADASSGWACTTETTYKWHLPCGFSIIVRVCNNKQLWSLLSNQRHRNPLLVFAKLWKR